MSNLEDLVPPLELCKRIPEGCFEDSALVWCNNPKAGFQVVPRIFITFDDNCEHHYEGILAPTLLEIMDAIDKTGCSYDFCEWDQNNITASALKAWGSFTDWGKLGQTEDDEDDD